MEKIGFLGAGGIARAHVYSLQAMKYYYDDVPELKFLSVSSASEQSRQNFAKKYDFSMAQAPDEFFNNDQIDTVFILGPNKVHFAHLKRALAMPAVKRIYLEKPVCATLEEEEHLKRLVSEVNNKIPIQIGFQYLQTSAVREALHFWQSGKLGNPIHFNLKYYHGDYLHKSYRDKRQTRLTRAPDGGAMADLGSHGISLLVAFLGKELSILHAMQAGHFEDVTDQSDLFSQISILEQRTKAVGTLSASRISAGTGDLILLEIYAEKGTLRYSSQRPEQYEYFLEETGCWATRPVGSRYLPVTSFPSGHVPPGWLRAMIHAHYLFLEGKDSKAFIPDLAHGLEVQRLVRQTAEHLSAVRNKDDLST